MRCAHGSRLITVVVSLSRVRQGFDAPSTLHTHPTRGAGHVVLSPAARLRKEFHDAICFWRVDPSS